MDLKAHPFVKWAGGKARLVAKLQKVLPNRIETYHEPFLGGGALFFALASTGRFKHAVLNDANAELINSYRIIASSCDELLEALRILDAEYHDAPKETYLRLRATKPGDPVAQAARLIFLNRTCFNGLYRVNKSGQFNVPFGSYVNPKIVDEPNLRACSEALRRVTLVSKDFSEVLKEAKPGDGVYCDPPYVPLNHTAYFTSYTSEGFGPKDQERLATELGVLANYGVAVVASNSDTEFVRKLYAGFEIHEVQMRRSINSKAGKRGPVSELMLVGRTPQFI